MSLAEETMTTEHRGPVVKLQPPHPRALLILIVAVSVILLQFLQAVWKIDTPK
jgi:hypothetical protein